MVNELSAPHIANEESYTNGKRNRLADIERPIVESITYQHQLFHRHLSQVQALPGSPLQEYDAPVIQLEVSE